MYDAVSVAQLRRVRADASDGSGNFTGAMPASALQAVLKVPPPLSPMWYCLSTPNHERPSVDCGPHPGIDDSARGLRAEARVPAKAPAINRHCGQWQTAASEEEKACLAPRGAGGASTARSVRESRASVRRSCPPSWHAAHRSIQGAKISGGSGSG